MTSECSSRLISLTLLYIVHSVLRQQLWVLHTSQVLQLDIGTVKEDVIANWAIDRVFDPQMDDDNRQKLLKGWKKAVKCSYGWAKED